MTEEEKEGEREGGREGGRSPPWMAALPEMAGSWLGERGRSQGSQTSMCPSESSILPVSLTGGGSVGNSKD